MKVRFAPSPTGNLHVGGARTALFNWLFAKNQGAKFVLRIEDTDPTRSRDLMVKNILDSLRWLGITWDEGPFFQSERLKRHQKIAKDLLEDRKAYRCFCSMELLAEKRKSSTSTGKVWKYDGTCRDLNQEQVQNMLQQKKKSVLRFKSPVRGSICFEDKVFGDIVHQMEAIEDFVLVRSDLKPTYHLGVVVDDIDMGVTHIIRGADHISNTPKQILLYRAMGKTVPVFAHLPLILGLDKTRLSKRHGATALTTYRDKGYFPESFRNFLALLGWAPDDGSEHLLDEELISQFSLKGVSKSNAVFDVDKLQWFNSQKLSILTAEKLLPYVKTELKSFGLWQTNYESGKKVWLLKVIDLLKVRARLLSDFVDQGLPFFSDDFEIEIKAKEKFLKDESLRTLLPELALRLETLSQFGLEDTEILLRAFAAEKKIKAGLLINGARVLLTGKSVAPGIFDVMVLMGQNRTVNRLAKTY